MPRRALGGTGGAEVIIEVCPTGSVRLAHMPLEGDFASVALHAFNDVAHVLMNDRHEGFDSLFGLCLALIKQHTEPGIAFCRSLINIVHAWSPSDCGQNLILDDLVNAVAHARLECPQGATHIHRLYQLSFLCKPMDFSPVIRQRYTTANRKGLSWLTV